MKLNKALLLLSTVAAVPLAGCVVETDTSVPFSGPAGQIVLTWSIDGDTSGQGCYAHKVSQIEIVVTDPNGNTIDDFVLACSVEGTNEYLPQGAYTGSATLEDASGNALTTTATANFTILADLASVPVDFDFPSSSFF
jgi:hypothetical protein